MNESLRRMLRTRRTERGIVTLFSGFIVTYLKLFSRELFFHQYPGRGRVASLEVTVFFHHLKVLTHEVSVSVSDGMKRW